MSLRRDLPTLTMLGQILDAVLTFSGAEGLAAAAADLDAAVGDLRADAAGLLRTAGLLKPLLTCFDLARQTGTLKLRHDALIAKLTMLGRQDRQFFIDLAAGLGYRITIYEYRPVICGITRCGETRPNAQLTYTYARCGTMRCGRDPILTIDLSRGDDWIWRLGPPNIRFWWRVAVLNTALRWQRGGIARCGVDHHCEFGLATDLECLIRRLKPGQTHVTFDYSQVVIGNG